MKAVFAVRPSKSPYCASTSAAITLSADTVPASMIPEFRYSINAVFAVNELKSPSLARTRADTTLSALTNPVYKFLIVAVSAWRTVVAR